MYDARIAVGSPEVLSVALSRIWMGRISRSMHALAQTVCASASCAVAVEPLGFVSVVLARKPTGWTIRRRRFTWSEGSQSLLLSKWAAFRRFLSARLPGEGSIGWSGRDAAFARMRRESPRRPREARADPKMEKWRVRTPSSCATRAVTCATAGSNTGSW